MSRIPCGGIPPLLQSEEPGIAGGVKVPVSEETESLETDGPDPDDAARQQRLEKGK